jgi:hypothetical protein
MRPGIGALLLALLMVGGCDPILCRAETLYLTLDYSGAAESADALTLDITVGGTHQHFEHARTPGRARDTLEVAFRSYPSQRVIEIAATAMHSGQAVGAGVTAGTLASSCTVLSISLTASAIDADSGAPNWDALIVDLSSTASNDLSTTPPPDLASSDLAVTVPTIELSGETLTELHPNGNGGTLPFDSHCTAGYAIVGFAFALATDSQGTATGINRADALCVKPLLTPKAGGGFNVTWDPNHASQIPGLGTSNQATVQYTCPMPAFLAGFAGRADASSLDLLLLSCAPILVASNNVVSLGPTVDSNTGVGSKTNGTPFGPVYCPPGQIATSVISRGTPGSPPVAFGFGCSTLSAH